MKASSNLLPVLAFVATLALLSACERDPPAAAPAPNPNPGADNRNPTEPTDPTGPTDPPPFAYQPNGEITGCYKNTWIEGGNPHMEKDNEYCVVRDGNDLILVPGKGMEEWRACTANRIRLVLLGGTEYAFCVRIVGHAQPPPHGPPHASYEILLYPPGANGKKYAKITAEYAVVGGPVHGGTAHSED